MLAVFAITLLLSATLLFLVQPMFAKMALPLLGGAPVVWNTCLVFYQAALLAGYAYAHALSRLALGRQTAIHALVLLVPLVALPIGIAPDAAPPEGAGAILWLVKLLATAVGLPFFVVSTTAPLVQRWFAHTGHAAAKDPYFLYAASNAGSLVALLGYPLLMEPSLRLAAQSRVWALGYLAFVPLVATCGYLAWRARELAPEKPSAKEPDEPAPAWPRRLRWIALAAVPSSLLMGLTTHLSTDLAAMPLLWVVPLALYLLTFVIVFSRRPILPHRWMLHAQPPLILALTVVFFFSVEHVVSFLIPLHVLAFFLTAMVCHGELAASRPAARHLTEFYLWMSVGGVLGGLFNAFVAPLAFAGTFEYELAILAACLLRPAHPSNPPATARTRFLDGFLPALVCVMMTVLALVLRREGVRFAFQVALIAVASAVAYSFVRRPVRFAFGVAAILGASAILSFRDSDVIYRDRSFFGVYKVKRYDVGCNVLVHGSTIHGAQSIEEARRREPITYYHRGTLVGAALTEYADRADPGPIAAVGLGSGSLAAYGTGNQEWDFYEIDPAMERLARNRDVFTYLSDCPAKVRVVIGDARLTLAKAPDGRYGMIILDAFSSDAVPVHLITREALALYLRKTAPDGMIAFHVSNRYLDLVPMLGALAREARLSTLVASGSTAGSDVMEYSSDWVLMARAVGDFGTLVDDVRWQAVYVPKGQVVWTDDFSNILGVIKRK